MFLSCDLIPGINEKDNEYGSKISIFCKNNWENDIIEKVLHTITIHNSFINKHHIYIRRDKKLLFSIIISNYMQNR